MTHSTDSQSEDGGGDEWKSSSGARVLRRASDRGSVPEGAIVMQKHEVQHVMQRLIENWTPKKEVWSLKHGSLLLGVLAGVNGAIFTAHFRQRMMLFSRARIASFAPSVVIPCFTAAIAQHMLSFDRLLREKPECLLCSDINAVSVQLLTGVLQPFLLSVLSSMAVAKLTMVYPLPPLLDIVGLYRTMRVLSKRLGPVALVCVASTVINTAIVSRAQGRAADRVSAKLEESTVFLS